MLQITVDLSNAWGFPGYLDQFGQFNVGLTVWLWGDEDTYWDYALVTTYNGSEMFVTEGDKRMGGVVRCVK
jgi:hypothetical protein